MDGLRKRQLGETTEFVKITTAQGGVSHSASRLVLVFYTTFNEFYAPVSSNVCHVKAIEGVF